MITHMQFDPILPAGVLTSGSLGGIAIFFLPQGLEWGKTVLNSHWFFIGALLADVALDGLAWPHLLPD